LADVHVKIAACSFETLSRKVMWQEAGREKQKTIIPSSRNYKNFLSVLRWPKNFRGQYRYHPPDKSEFRLSQII